MDISLVIPLYNEDESIKELYDWIVRVAKNNSLTYEIIFVNDGSTDNSWKVIEELSEIPQKMEKVLEQAPMIKDISRMFTALSSVVIMAKAQLFTADSRKRKAMW